MLTCKQVSVLVSQSLDRPLSWRERMMMRLHLCICGYCRRFSQQLRWLRAQFKRYETQQLSDPSNALPAPARQRIAQAIDAEGASAKH